MEIETDISSEHSNLIEIFFEANEMPGVSIEKYDQEINQVLHSCIKLVVRDDESAERLTAMGLRNYGVKNMLDHYLLRCGILPNELHPRYYKPIQMPGFI